MLPARKEEVFLMEGESKKVEERLGALEVSVAVVRTQNAHIMTDVSELKGDMKDLRTRMTDGFQSVHKELSSAKIWALLIAAAMLGVMARGFHWI
jgi:hypothetical protein